MIIARARNRGAKQKLIILNCFDGIDKKGQELEVSHWRFPWTQQVDTSICLQRPVVVFSRTVDPCKWFFMQQHFKVVPAGNFAHDVHKQCIVINR